MRFTDREDAGRRLAEKLNRFRGLPDGIVLALPRGGVVPGRIVADALDLPLDIVVPRKIGAPWDEEYAIGAIAEKGEAVWNAAEHDSAPRDYLDKKIAEQKTEIRRRLAKYRHGLKPRVLKGMTAIIIDDGIATGLTMRAAISAVKAEGAARVIIAIPFAPKEAVAELRGIADEVVTVFVPEPFAGSIGSYYEDFPQVEDEEVIRLMKSKL